jgi:DMSO/TMAO reductase YedYZ molybdopterin-dependent catalytic subunit
MAHAPRGGGIPASLTWAAGVGAVAFGVGIGELTAAFAAPTASPTAAVGATLIDLAPPWAKDAAIALFGTADKAALLTGIAVVMVVLAATAGWLQSRMPPWGAVVVAAFGVLGAVLASARPGAEAPAWVPSAVAGAVAAIALTMLARMLSGARRPLPAATAPEREPAHSLPLPAALPGAARRAAPSRRSFFAWAGAAAAAGILASIAAGVRTAGSVTVAAARRALQLPTARTAAPPIPEGAELGIPGLASLVTPSDRFYRIDTALIVPEVDPAGWRLRVHGMVAREIDLGWDELLALPLEESWTTLACVSNEVGGTLIGNARWLGYPLRHLLARAEPLSGADMVLSRSADGFTASTPLEALTDDRDAILAVGMNGAPLPVEHGFPVRMVVPGLYGYVSATKWVVDLEVTRFDRARAYWTDRGWSERGPIKLQSRIDVPRKNQGLSAGESVIAGVAWHQGIGVSGVEVQVDDGPWESARLAPAISEDTWVQWSLPWTATVGDHLIRCRATSGDGERQTPDRARPAPDGATGWHERHVQVF